MPDQPYNDHRPEGPTRAGGLPGQAPEPAEPIGYAGSFNGPSLFAGPPGPWGVLATLGWWIGALALSMTAGAILVFLFVLARQGEHFPSPERIEDLSRDGDLITLSMGLEFALGMTVMGLALYLRKPYPAREYLAAKPIKARALAAWIGLGLAYQFGSSGLADLFGVPPSDWMEGVFTSASCMPCLLVGVALLAPLWEEVFYRGFIYKGFEARFGPLWAVIVSVVPWTLMHSMQYEWYFLVLLLGRGLLYAEARRRTGSIVAPTAMHMMDNALASAAMFLTQ